MTESKHLGEAEFAGHFSMDDFLVSCHRAFELYGRGEIENPPREEQAREGYFRLDMPAEWAGRYRGRKIIEEHSDVAAGRLAKREAYVELEDLQKGGRVRLDAGWLTDMRTGAAGALGLQYLAGKGVRRVALIGTGRISGMLALAADRLFALEQIRATSRTREKREAFAAEVGKQLRAPLEVVAGLEACLEGAEAVLAAVPTPQPILGLEDLEKVPYLVAIAGDGRTRQLQPEVLETRPVVVDVLAQAQKSGDFAWARTQGRLERIRLARDAGGKVLDIGDAACGRLPGGQERPSVVYLTGMGAQDLMAAIMICARPLT